MGWNKLSEYSKGIGGLWWENWWSGRWNGGKGVVGMAVGEMSDVKIEYVANGTQWEHMFCYRIARHVIIPPFCLVFKAKWYLKS